MDVLCAGGVAVVVVVLDCEVGGATGLGVAMASQVGLWWGFVDVGNYGAGVGKGLSC